MYFPIFEIIGFSNWCKKLKKSICDFFKYEIYGLKKCIYINFSLNSKNSKFLKY